MITTPFLEKWVITVQNAFSLLFGLFFADFTWQKLLAPKSVINNCKTPGSRGRERARKGRATTRKDVFFSEVKMSYLRNVMSNTMHLCSKASH